MKNEAKVTIGRRNMGDESVIAISIGDRSSGLTVTEIIMTMENFALALTGLSYCKAEYQFKPNQFTIDNICKDRETKSILLNKPDTYQKNEQKADIKKQIEESGELVDGWMIFNDGCSSQQPGDKHKANLYRFV